MDGKAIGFFLLGTFGGIFILSMLAMLAGVGVSALISVFAMGFPIFALIGFAWFITRIFKKRDDE